MCAGCNVMWGGVVWGDGAKLFEMQAGFREVAGNK